MSKLGNESCVDFSIRYTFPFFYGGPIWDYPCLCSKSKFKQGAPRGKEFPFHAHSQPALCWW